MAAHQHQPAGNINALDVQIQTSTIVFLRHENAKRRMRDGEAIASPFRIRLPIILRHRLRHRLRIPRCIHRRVDDPAILDLHPKRRRDQRTEIMREQIDSRQKSN